MTEAIPVHTRRRHGVALQWDGTNDDELRAFLGEKKLVEIFDGVVVIRDRHNHPHLGYKGYWFLQFPDESDAEAFSVVVPESFEKGWEHTH